MQTSFYYVEIYMASFGGFEIKTLLFYCKFTVMETALAQWVETGETHAICGL